ncbi:MAG: hypothetical protein ABI237_02145 [Ginsengibacter sp.]
MIKYILRIVCFSFIAICFNHSGAHAQYYYKDIMSNQKLNNEFSILKNAHIKLIKITSFDENDQPSEGFFCEKKINKNFAQSEMLSKSNITGQSLLVTDYNSAGKINRATTSTPNTTNTVEFEYDTVGNLSLIRTKTIADGDSTGITETHEYFYDEKNNPVKMLRKKNNILISTISFLSDDKGNIVEENPVGNTTDKKYYYYYDDSNHLTDVVHYNIIAKRLLPDYMFEYNTNSKEPTQMISVDETGRNYFIWRYAYDDKKLPEIQKCYSKEKKLLGTIQFEYQ